MNAKPTVIIVAGATASGKTATAIELAQRFHTEILSADSRQCFKELNIGVAKPAPDELLQAQHYFINSHSIFDEMNAGVYEKYALDVLNKIFLKNNIAIVVGGTGLYIKALCEGVDEMPAISAFTRNSIIKNYRERGLIWLQNEIKNKDAEFWETAEQQNPQRLMRALEFVEETGKSITTYRSGEKAQRNFSVLKIALDWQRAALYDKINRRVDKMIDEGLINEVKELYPYRSLNALQTVGYSELFDYFDGKISLLQAIEKIKINTRHYAKRQLTWFRKDRNFHWFPPSEIEKIVSFIKSNIA